MCRRPLPCGEPSIAPPLKENCAARCQPRELATLPYLDLKERPSAIPSAAPAAAFARSLEKHRRWLDNRCRLGIDVLADRDQVMDAFGSLVSFLHTRWHGSTDRSALDDPRTRRFHEAALPRLLNAGCLRMIRLSADGQRTIAVFYGMARGPWWGYYLCGYDREWAGRIRLGQVTLAIAIDIARRDGAAEFDFLKGAHRNNTRGRSSSGPRSTPTSSLKDPVRSLRARRAPPATRRPRPTRPAAA